MFLSAFYDRNFNFKFNKEPVYVYYLMNVGNEDLDRGYIRFTLDEPTDLNSFDRVMNYNVFYSFFHFYTWD